MVLDAIGSMTADGLAPAALIETSPANYQAWIKLPLPTELRNPLAHELARQYGGYRTRIDAQHYGRLAGFTIRSKNTQETGGSPMRWPMPAPDRWRLGH